ncbi:MAG: polysaccharide biosynthesis/export family protein [Phormidesmis sp.]
MRVPSYLSFFRVPSVLTVSFLASLGGPALAQMTGQPTSQPMILTQPASQPTNGQLMPNVNTQPLPNQSSQLDAQPVGSSTLSTSYSNATYILGAGDQISLSVIGYPEFTGVLALLPDGSVTLPLIGGVRAAGLTPNQLSALLTQQMRAYLVDPVVDVGLVVMRPVLVTVSGEVHRPGPLQLSSLTSSNGNPLGSGETNAQLGDRPALPTLSSAIQLSGGITRDADIRQVVIRRPLAGGQVETLTLNLWEAITSDAGIADMGLRDGDSIFIPRLSGNEIDSRTVARSSLAPSTIRVKVVGEVVTPGEISVPPDSSISSAVAIAGGPTTDAQLSNVSLVRQGLNGQIEQEEVDLSNLVDDYQVRDGDVVVVAKRGYLSVVDGIGRVLNPLNIFRLFGF